MTKYIYIYVQVYYKHIIYTYTMNRNGEDSRNLSNLLGEVPVFSTIQRAHSRPLTPPKKTWRIYPEKRTAGSPKNHPFCLKENYLNPNLHVFGGCKC